LELTADPLQHVRAMNSPSAKRYLPWVVATTMFMEQLDSTILNTAVPSMAVSLHVPPLSLKSVVTSYIIALAVCIPISGWMADRFGSRRVFASAVAVFTMASIACGLAINVHMLVAARVLQGLGAAMMLPVGRLTILRVFPKTELLRAMNFVIMPALFGPLLGPAIGGLIVDWFSWRGIFFVNVPVGLAALLLSHRYMPNHHGSARRLDIVGMTLFGAGIALVTWLLEIFGERPFDFPSAAAVASLAFGLLAAYGWRARRAPNPIFDLALFEIRTFRVSIMGGFITRLGVGGLPFLLPLLFQLGLGFSAWQSGLLMMPPALGAIGMKWLSIDLLRRLGYRQVLIVNTVMMGLNIGLFSLVLHSTPIALIVILGLTQGLFNSLQFSSMNSLAYADIEPCDSSMASSLASSLQQVSIGFGLAVGSLVAAWYLGDSSQSDRWVAVVSLHHAFLTLGALTIISSWSFWTLHSNDGAIMSMRAQVEDR
jgi:EmrB/QacA subfamily drug resistance transporter